MTDSIPKSKAELFIDEGLNKYIPDLAPDFLCFVPNTDSILSCFDIRYPIQPYRYKSPFANYTQKDIQKFLNLLPAGSKPVQKIFDHTCLNARPYFYTEKLYLVFRKICADYYNSHGVLVKLYHLIYLFFTKQTYAWMFRDRIDIYSEMHNEKHPKFTYTTPQDSQKVQANKISPIRKSYNISPRKRESLRTTSADIRQKHRKSIRQTPVGKFKICTHEVYRNDD